MPVWAMRVHKNSPCLYSVACGEVVSRGQYHGLCFVLLSFPQLTRDNHGAFGLRPPFSSVVLGMPLGLAHGR